VLNIGVYVYPKKHGTRESYCSLFDTKVGLFPDYQPKASGIKWHLPTACLPIYSFAFWRKPVYDFTYSPSVKRPVAVASKVSIKTNDTMKNIEIIESTNLKKQLQNENVFVKQQIVSM
jgi:hypothetical protein